MSSDDRASFRDMVRRKREEVTAASGTQRRLHTLDTALKPKATTSGSSGNSSGPKTKSTSSLAASSTASLSSARRLGAAKPAAAGTRFTERGAGSLPNLQTNSKKPLPSLRKKRLHGSNESSLSSTMVRPNSANLSTSINQVDERTSDVYESSLSTFQSGGTLTSSMYVSGDSLANSSFSVQSMPLNPLSERPRSGAPHRWTIAQSNESFNSEEESELKAQGSLSHEEVDATVRKNHISRKQKPLVVEHPHPWNISTKGSLESNSIMGNSRLGSGALGTDKRKKPAVRSGRSTPNVLPDPGAETRLQKTTTMRQSDAVDESADEDDYVFDDGPPGLNRNFHKYPVTPHQMRIFSLVCPSHDELEGASEGLRLAEKASHFVVQAYQLESALDLRVFQTVVNKICSEYKVLCTRFWRNAKIVDGDVLGIFEKSAWSTFRPDRFVTDVETNHNDKDLVPDWLHSFEGLDKPFHLLVTVPVASQQEAPPVVVLVGSTAVVDEVSCQFVMREIFSTYANAIRKQNHPDSRQDKDAWMQYIEQYVTKEEADDFIDFAYSLKPHRQAYIFWKDLCIETVQDSIEGREREEIENQLRRLTVDVEAHRLQVASLTRRKGELENELVDLKQQRMQIDLDSFGPVETYVDPVSHEVIEVTKAAKAAIIRVVLGEEAVEDNVTALLAKHDVPPEVQSRLSTAHMTLETFSAISDEQLIMLGLLTKDRRKILALSEYVRNRVKESLQEQTKIKYALERKILKCQRELDSAATQLKAAQNALDTNDDMSIRLKKILKPPTTENRLSPISLASLTARKEGLHAIENSWGSIPFEVPTDIVQNLRNFKEGCRLAILQRRATHHRRIPSGQDSETSSTDEGGTPMPRGEEFDDQDDTGPTGDSDRRQLSSAESVCLGAFAVMLKHIVGQDKFLLGYRADFRKSGALVGPLSDSVPMKLDLGAKGVTFNSLVGVLSKQIREARRQAQGTPYAALAKQHQLPEEFPVEFCYFSRKDTQVWQYAGIGLRELLPLEGSFTVNTGDHDVSYCRLWSADKASGADLKLILAEGADKIAGALRYRRSKFDDDQVSKWVAKYMTTLEGIEFGSRKLIINNMISRYYSSVFLSSRADSDSQLQVDQ
ncbi:hypothetical protein DFJ73DRAFT_158480 [Zopfochytrium polystomum]|nr:hypothetical protein DFJ73DRAFT_158480 [Zopfochytrium polystomum]